MADYRSLCNECGHEVGFGSHASDCSAPVRAREASRKRKEEKQKEEEALLRPWKQLDDEDFISMYQALHNDIDDLRSTLYPLEKEKELVNRYALSANRYHLVTKALRRDNG